MPNLLQREFATGWHKSVNRSIIGEALQSDQLIEQLVVLGDGRIDVRTMAWDAYWASVLPQMPPECRHLLATLEKSRHAYFSSRFELSKAIAYCHSYFRLLRELLCLNDAAIGVAALRALLGLESFAIAWSDDQDAAAAGAITIRHPVYLLAKLREPKAYEDPKFLPLICPHSCHSDTSDLFYYYRQIKVHDDPAASLLVYPAANLGRRIESFACIESLASALSFKTDPRCRQRAKAITDWAISPFLSQRQALAGWRSGSELALVDIGGGSGALLGAVCKRLVAEHRTLLGDRRFVWSIVDLSLQDASRQTASPELRQQMSYIDYQPTDYKTWLSNEDEQHERSSSDVVLICRLLNNLSRMGIEMSNAPDVRAALTRRRGEATSAADFHPADCLDEPTPDCTALIASNGRAKVFGGTTFRQASLSDYFRGLRRISQPLPSASPPEDSLFFPLRRFDHDALMLDNGSSIFDQLCRRTELVVIEDVDLTPELLQEHLAARGLHHLAASDATDRVRMQTGNLLCITRREFESALPRRRIW
ncbi:MAG: hypothetical protein WD534_16645 [Phycisphaeraceae bacterium]